ncbi:MAG TPA: hypothetical protein VFW33_19500 [Gemmataceae bacterium]|nr:hypothetical protein [Gemmataceae bacterium]
MPATAYEDLKCGGSMCAGTVVSVTVEGNSEGSADPAEWGTLSFRVARTLVGPAQRDMTVRYFYWLNDARRAQGIPVPEMATDIGGCYSPWPARPKPGERLLLLLADERMARKLYSKVYGNVYYRWAVSPEDPLVDGFALAGRYLAAEGYASADELFVQLCESRFKNMRSFARSAAFAYVGWSPGDTMSYPFHKGYNAARQSRLALLYLKHAAPRLTPEERIHVSWSFSSWFGLNLEGVTHELVKAFDEWFMEELAVRDDMPRRKATLESLENLAEKIGMTKVVSLFTKSGRDGLRDALRDCAHCGDPAVEKLGKGLLAKLGDK